MKRTYGIIRRVASTILPTKWGVFRMVGFERPPDGRGYAETAIALILEDRREDGLRGVPEDAIRGTVVVQ